MPLGAGQGYSASAPVLLSAPGTYYLYVLTDRYNFQPESNEANNAAHSAGKVVVGNEEVMGRIVPADVHREIEDPITGSDDRILIELIGNADARADVVPRIVGHATRVL